MKRGYRSKKKNCREREIDLREKGKGRRVVSGKRVGRSGKGGGEFGKWKTENPTSWA